MATIYKRGKTWYLNWSDTAGQHRISLKKYNVTTQQEAENYRLAKELELGTGTKIISNTPLFEDFKDDYLDWYRHEYPSSYDRMNSIISNHLLPVFSKTPLNAISAGAVESWKTKRLTEKAAPGTVAKELRGFKAMIKRAVEWGKLDFHPFENVKSPKELTSKPPSYYTKEDMESIYKVSTYYRYHWQFLTNTGLRRGEFLNLKPENILDTVVRVLSNNESRTKSGKWREVPLNASSRAAADKLLAHNSPRFVQCIHPANFSRAFERDLKKAKLPGSIHWLRHTFISHLVISGMNLRKVQKLAGHANYKTTERYAHLSPKLLEDLEGVEI